MENESTMIDVSEEMPPPGAGFTLPTLPSDRTAAVFDRPELTVQLTRRTPDEQIKLAPSNNFTNDELDGVETDEENELKTDPQEADLDVDWQMDGTICRAPGKTRRAQPNSNRKESSTITANNSSSSSTTRTGAGTESSLRDAKPCIEFSTYGRCHYSDRCKFAHVLSEEQAQKTREKWTYVSLESAPKGTDKANAMSFINELRARKQKEELEALRRARGEPMDVDDMKEPRKMEYKRPAKRKADEEMTGGRNECVVGKKPTRLGGQGAMTERQKKRPLMCMEDDDINDVD